MAKGQVLTRHQQGVVRRYYEQKDTIMSQKLGEIVSDLYLAAGDEKGSERLWKRAQTALQNTSVDPARVASVCADRDVAKLAELVNRHFANGKGGNERAGTSRGAGPGGSRGGGSRGGNGVGAR